MERQLASADTIAVARPLELDFGHLPRNQLAGKWQPHEGFIAAA
jgi:hypothetical protein